MKNLISNFIDLMVIQRLSRVNQADRDKGSKSAKLERGFSFVELLLSVILLAIFASGLATAFYVPSSGMKSIETKQFAYTYAQREMEFLINRNFDEVTVGINRTEYLDDNFEYSINTTLVDNQTNLKNVRILFYPNPVKGAGNIGESSDILSDLVNNLVKVGPLEYWETFNDGNYAPPIFQWDNSHGIHWKIVDVFSVSFLTSPASQFSHHNQLGTSYPTAPSWDPPSFNYSVEGRVYLETRAVDTWAAIGGRCTTGGVGYYVRIDVEPSIPRTRIRLMDTNTAIPSAPIYTNTSLFFNQWVTLKLEMIGTNISYYFNGTFLGNVTNSAHASGSPFLRAFNNVKDRYIYFDDIKIQFP